MRINWHEVEAKCLQVQVAIGAAMLSQAINSSQRLLTKSAAVALKPPRKLFDFQITAQSHNMRSCVNKNSPIGARYDSLYAIESEEHIAKKRLRSSRAYKKSNNRLLRKVLICMLHPHTSSSNYINNSSLPRLPSRLCAFSCFALATTA